MPSSIPRSLLGEGRETASEKSKYGFLEAYPGGNSGTTLIRMLETPCFSTSRSEPCQNLRIEGPSSMKSR